MANKKESTFIENAGQEDKASKALTHAAWGALS
jgi:hypothetical protein